MKKMIVTAFTWVAGRWQRVTSPPTPARTSWSGAPWTMPPWLRDVHIITCPDCDRAIGGVVIVDDQPVGMTGRPHGPNCSHRSVTT